MYSAQRLQKLIYLDLSTDCFMKISLHSPGLEVLCRQSTIKDFSVM